MSKLFSPHLQCQPRLRRAKNFLGRLKNKYSDVQDNSRSNAEADTDDRSNRAKESTVGGKAVSSGKSKKFRLQSTDRDDDRSQTQEDGQSESSEHNERFGLGSDSTGRESDDHEEQSGTDDGNEHDAEQENGHHERADIHIEAGNEKSASEPEERHWQQEVLSEHGQGQSEPANRRVWELQDEVHPEPHNDHYPAHGDGSHPDLRASEDYGSEWQQQHEEQHQCDYYAEGVLYDGDPSYAEG